MFNHWKRKQEEKKAMNEAIAQSRYWRTHPKLQSCLQAMRGSCTVAPIGMHEAVAAVVSIALQEDAWTRTDRLPEGFLSESVYIIWNDDRLPALKADRGLLLQSLACATAVAPDTYLVSETMDRAVHLGHGGLRLYDLTA